MFAIIRWSYQSDATSVPATNLPRRAFPEVDLTIGALKIPQTKETIESPSSPQKKNNPHIRRPFEQIANEHQQKQTNVEIASYPPNLLLDCQRAPN
jgi:hypothetical protein